MNESKIHDSATGICDETTPEGPSGDHLSLLARGIIEATAAGHPLPAVLLDSLAAAVLDAPAVRLARAVLAGGPHKLTRAIELAQHIAQPTEQPNEQPDHAADHEPAHAAAPLHSYPAQPFPQSSPSSPLDDSPSDIDRDDGCDDGVTIGMMGARR